MKKIYFTVITVLFFVFPLVSIIAQDENATESAETSTQESVTEKVQEKIERVRSNPKSYMGTVTDISAETIQIKTNRDEMLQISVNVDETLFINYANKGEKIKFSDVAIADYVIAMGYLDENKVLDAKRVLVSPLPQEINRRIVIGEIQTVKDRKIHLDLDGEPFALSFPKRWKGPEINEFDENMKVIAVFLADEDSNTIRTIEIISPEE